MHVTLLLEKKNTPKNKPLHQNYKMQAYNSHVKIIMNDCIMMPFVFYIVLTPFSLGLYSNEAKFLHAIFFTRCLFIFNMMCADVWWHTISLSSACSLWSNKLGNHADLFIPCIAGALIQNFNNRNLALPSIYAAVHVMRTPVEQQGAVGLTNEGGHYGIRKCVTKVAGVWGGHIFRETYHNSRKYAPPLFEEILEFIANGHISRDYSIYPRV